MSQHEVSYGIVCHASYEAVASLVAKFDRYHLWAPSVVSCSLMEGQSDPATPHCVRRSVVRAIDRPWRETLNAIHASSDRTFVTTRMAESQELDAHAPTVREQRDAFVAHLAGDGDAPRVVPVSEVGPITDAICTLSVFRISNQPLKCFAHFQATFDTLRDGDVPEARRFFLDLWGGPLVEALASYALNVEFPSTTPRPPFVSEFEDLLAGLAATGDSRADSVRKLIDCYRESETQHSRGLQQNDALRAELQSRDLMIARLARDVADLEERCQATEHRHRLAHAAGTGKKDAGTMTNATEPAAPPGPPAANVSEPPRTVKVRCVPEYSGEARIRERFDRAKTADGMVPFDALVTLFSEHVEATAKDLAVRLGGVAPSKRVAAALDARRWADRALGGQVSALSYDQFALAMLYLERC